MLKSLDEELDRTRSTLNNHLEAMEANINKLENLVSEKSSLHLALHELNATINSLSGKLEHKAFGLIKKSYLLDKDQKLTSFGPYIEKNHGLNDVFSSLPHSAFATALWAGGYFDPFGYLEHGDNVITNSYKPLKPERNLIAFNLFKERTHASESLRSHIFDNFEGFFHIVQIYNAAAKNARVYNYIIYPFFSLPFKWHFTISSVLRFASDFGILPFSPLYYNNYLTQILDNIFYSAFLQFEGLSKAKNQMVHEIYYQQVYYYHSNRIEGNLNLYKSSFGRRYLNLVAMSNSFGYPIKKYQSGLSSIEAGLGQGSGTPEFGKVFAEDDSKDLFSHYLGELQGGLYRIVKGFWH